MNVRELIHKIKFDSSSPFLFNINNKTYTYYEVVYDEQLLQVPINTINIEGQLSELNDKDVIKVISRKDVKDSDIDIVLPYNSHYYLIMIIIK